jgi:chromosome segregation ATPase
MSVFNAGLEIAAQSIVFFWIGFLLAALMAVICFPLVHNRAARLTARRIEALTPCSMEEIQAEKDSMRAEFAISARRFETTIEDFRAKTCAQVTALAQKSDAISRLESEREVRAAKLSALEQRASAFDAREKSLLEQLRASSDEAARLRDALRAAEKTIVDQRLTRKKIGNVVVEFSRLVSHKRKEITALRDEVNTIRHQTNGIADSVKSAQTRAPRERIDTINGSMASHRNGGLNGAANGGSSNGGHDAVLMLAAE